MKMYSNEILKKKWFAKFNGIIITTIFKKKMNIKCIQQIEM